MADCTMESRESQTTVRCAKMHPLNRQLRGLSTGKALPMSPVQPGDRDPLGGILRQLPGVACRDRPECSRTFSAGRAKEACVRYRAECPRGYSECIRRLAAWKRRKITVCMRFGKRTQTVSFILFLLWCRPGRRSRSGCRPPASQQAAHPRSPAQRFGRRQNGIQ